MVHDILSVVDELQVRCPRNYFALQPAPRLPLNAGSIGITSILPKIRAAEAADAR